MIFQLMQQDAEMRGEKRGRLEAAKGMLREGLPVGIIVRATGLSDSEIGELKIALQENASAGFPNAQDQE